MGPGRDNAVGLAARSVPVVRPRGRRVERASDSPERRFRRRERRESHIPQSCRVASIAIVLIRRVCAGVRRPIVGCSRRVRARDHRRESRCLHRRQPAAPRRGACVVGAGVEVAVASKPKHRAGARIAHPCCRARPFTLFARTVVDRHRWSTRASLRVGWRSRRHHLQRRADRYDLRRVHHNQHWPPLPFFRAESLGLVPFGSSLR